MNNLTKNEKSLSRKFWILQRCFETFVQSNSKAELSYVLFASLFSDQPIRIRTGKYPGKGSKVTPFWVEYFIRVGNQTKNLTVSAWMQAHSWIEAHPIQKLIQAHSKSDFETIQAQLEYKPTFPNFLSINNSPYSITSRCSNLFWSISDWIAKKGCEIYFDKYQTNTKIPSLIL